MLETSQTASDGSTLIEAVPLASEPVPAPKNTGRTKALILFGMLFLVILVVLLILIGPEIH
jgi:hypothetical protein